MSFITILVFMIVMGITGILTGEAQAEVKGKMVEYSIDGATMEGYVAYDEELSSLRPGVLIVHDWMGLGDFTKAKADALAKEGYVAFAADIYGKGVRPADTKEAATLATHYKEDRALLRRHVRAAYDTLTAMPNVDGSKIIATGFCFGGTTALELARSGAKLAGTVSFHGGLSTPSPKDAKNIKSPVLILHGADDPLVPEAEVAAFKDEMQKAGVDMSFVAYKGAVHSFTNPDAGDDNSKGFAYNAAADKASWLEFKRFVKKAVQ